MVHEFKLPDVGDGEEEADVLKWMVEEGDGVREDDPIAEVETERAIIEIPSPVSGEVLELHAEERETVAVGATLVTFDTEEDGEENREEGGVEILDDDGNTAVEVDAGGAVDQEGTEYPEGEEAGEDFASPSTKLLAREVGVNIEEVEGSGPEGRVVAQDVLRAAKEEQDDREEENGRDAGAGSGAGPESEGTEDVGHPASEEGKTPTRENEEELSHEFGQEKAPAVDPETVEDTRMFGGEEDEDDVGSKAEDMFGDVGEEEGEMENEETGKEELEEEETGKADDEEGVAWTETEEKEETTETTETEESTGTAGAAGEIGTTEAEEAAEKTDKVETTAETTDAQGEKGTAEAVEDSEADSTETVGEDETHETEPTSEAVATDGVAYAGNRRRVGERLRRSAEAPLVTHHEAADAERLVEVRERLRDDVEARLSYTPFFVKACGVALKDHEVLNSRIDEDEEMIRFHEEVNIGVATETEDGLRFPVVENVAEKGVADIAADLEDAAERARGDENENTDGGEDGTFTVYNVGAIGGEGTTPLPNHPETAAVAIGEIRRRPFVVGGEVVARQTVPLSLTFDHRAADSAGAARFANDLKRYLNDPMEMLL